MLHCWHSFKDLRFSHSACLQAGTRVARIDGQLFIYHLEPAFSFFFSSASVLSRAVITYPHLFHANGAPAKKIQNVGLDRPTDRQTNRQTDRQTWRKEAKKKKGNVGERTHSSVFLDLRVFVISASALGRLRGAVYLRERRRERERVRELGKEERGRKSGGGGRS